MKRTNEITKAIITYLNANGYMVCNVCGVDFVVDNGRLNRGVAKFCSRECANIAMRKRVVVTCAICSKSFERRIGLLKYQKNHCCSKKCRDKIKSINKKGEKHYGWKGGKRDESKIARQSREWIYWRREVFVRDNYTCQVCKARKVELHPHHIKRFSTHPHLRFDVNNGITVCVPCHKSIHSKSNKIIQFTKTIWQQEQITSLKRLLNT